MDKITGTKQFLKNAGLPETDIYCYIILAMAGITPEMEWHETETGWDNVQDIIEFININYDSTYTKKKMEAVIEILDLFIEAEIVVDNRATDDSIERMYRLTDETIQILRDKDPSNLLYYQILLQNSLNIKGKLKSGIFEKFIPRFASNSKRLYNWKEDDKEKLLKLGFKNMDEYVVPDVILYCEDRNLLYLIDCYLSTGPIIKKRILEIQQITKDVTAEKIFVSAFPDYEIFMEYSKSLASNTKVWIVDKPEQIFDI